MSIEEMIFSLRSGDSRRIIAAAAEAADALEVMEERLAIMGELLTEKEWAETEAQARQRIIANKETEGRL